MFVMLHDFTCKLPDKPNVANLGTEFKSDSKTIIVHLSKYLLDLRALLLAASKCQYWSI